jgi:hypothetical protein
MILEWDYARFAKKIEGRTPVEELIEQARGDEELTAVLRRFEDKGEVGFRDIVQSIQSKEGDLNDTEMIFLLLDQLWQERVAPPTAPRPA